MKSNVVLKNAFMHSYVNYWENEILFQSTKEFVLFYLKCQYEVLIFVIIIIDKFD